MPSIPAGFVEATFVYRRIGAVRDSTVSLGFDVADFASQSATFIANNIRTVWAGAAAPAAPANMLAAWSFLGVQVVKQMEEGPVLGQSFVTTVGTIAQPGLPVNCAVLVNKNTDMGGRRNRGRMFLPPAFPSEGSVDEAGAILGSSVTALQGYINSAIAGWATANYEPVLYHSEAPFTPTPIVGLSVQGLLASQRRRMRK